MIIGDLDSYNFSYPDDLVALNPLAEKDQANMLLFKKNIFSYQKVSDLLTQTISTLGENISVSRFSRFAIGD